MFVSGTCRALNATITQIQALRPYYAFPETDVDRFINGRIKQVLLSPCELDVIASFPWEVSFKDHGIGLDFNDKARLVEFFEKTRVILFFHPAKDGLWYGLAMVLLFVFADLRTFFPAKINSYQYTPPRGKTAIIHRVSVVSFLSPSAARSVCPTPASCA
jgi:hypothetical protein